MSGLVTRREAIRVASLATLTACSFSSDCWAGPGNTNGAVDKLSDPIAVAAPLVFPGVSWSAVELNGFLEELPPSALVSLKKALGLLKPDATGNMLKGSAPDVQEILERLLWVSTNIIALPFLDARKIAYHDLVKWVADDAGVDAWIIDTQPTFVIERAYQERIFVTIWDKLDANQRQELLTKLEEMHGKDKGGQIADKAAIAALSGASALAALATTVYFASFTFYSTMSVVICTVAGWFGVTLPFAAYTTASSTVAFLSGPVGWALLAVAAAVGVALAGRANKLKTGAFICQVHALKVAALQAAGKLTPDVFNALGDPIRRQLIGKWKSRYANGSVDFDLAGDGSFTSENHFDEPRWIDGHGWVHSGKGNWKIHDGKLTVHITAVWALAAWKGWDEKYIHDEAIAAVTGKDLKFVNASVGKTFERR